MGGQADSRVLSPRRIVVEDVAVLEGEATRTVRRMAFVSNRGLVQSEAVLRGTGGNAVPPSHGGKRKSNKKKSQAGNLSFEGLHVDQGTLAMEYHNNIVAGVCLGASRRSLQPFRCLLLPMRARHLWGAAKLFICRAYVWLPERI